MNIFVTGSSSILGSKVVELLFSEGHTLYTCNALPSTAHNCTDTIKSAIGDRPIDIVILLQANELHHPDCGGSQYGSVSERHLRFNRAILDYFCSSDHRPEIILSASSVNIYTSGTSSPAVESSPLGDGYLSTFYHDLEHLTESAESKGIRVVNMRLGTLVSKTSPPPLPLYPILKIIADCIGSRKMSVSWVSQEDAARAVKLLLDCSDISGPVNITSGDIVNRADFLDQVVRYFKILKMPPLPYAFARLALPPDDKHLLLSDVSAIPYLLMERGFLFENISLQDYLQ